MVITAFPSYIVETLEMISATGNYCGPLIAEYYVAFFWWPIYYENPVYPECPYHNFAILKDNISFAGVVINWKFGSIKQGAEVRGLVPYLSNCF